MKNHPHRTPGPNRKILACMPILAAGLASSGGCQRPVGLESAAQAPTVETYVPQSTWRFRLTEGSTLPPGVAVELNDQFQVLEIRDARRWREVREALRLRGVDEQPDFERGMVVGLAGSLGAPLTGGWPLRISHLRRSGGIGSLTVHTKAGLYNPTRNSPYCVMTYVPKLERLAIVRIDHRLFYLD